MRQPVSVPLVAMPQSDAVLEVLRDLLIEVRGLRADLAPRHPISTLNRADRARLAALLPALAGVYGSAPFVARDVVDADAPAALRLVADGLDAQQLGSLFARAGGQVVDGFLVERSGDELHRRLWCVFRSREPTSDRGSPQRSGDAL